MILACDLQGLIDMQCDQLSELVSDYCDGSMTAAMRVPFEAHVAACADCREIVDGVQRVWTSLNEAPTVETPPGVRAMVWQRIEAAGSAATAPQPKRRFSLVFARRNAGWLAAGALVVLLAGIVVPGQFSAARMMFPWSLFYAGQTVRLNVGPVSIRSEADVPIVSVSLTNNSASDMVAWLGDGVSAADPNTAEILIPAGKTVHAAWQMGLTSSRESIVLYSKSAAGSGTVSTKTISIQSNAK